MNRWKRMYKFLIPLALALFFVGLSRCGITEMAIEAMGIEKMALQTSFEDWLKAGGKILVVGIYFNGITPLDDDCKPIATKLLSDNPSVANVRFYGLTSEAFCQTANKDVAEIWDDNEQSQLGRLSYHQWDIQENTP